MRICKKYGTTYGIISRCPIDVDKGWLDEKEQNVLYWNWSSTNERFVAISAPKIGYDFLLFLYK